MVDLVYETLLELYEIQKEYGFSTFEVEGYTNFVFTNRFDRVYNPSTVNRAIERIRTSYNADEVVKAAKEHREPIIIPHFSCHHIRHTFCTRLCECESNLNVIQDIMGHADIQTTMNIYAEATKQAKQKAITEISNMAIF
jgi:integrase